MPPHNRWQARLSEIGIRWRLLSKDDHPQRPAATKLTERIKELNCLYALSQLAEDPHASLEFFLATAVDILPPSWQYPETACASIVLEGQTYESLYFEPSRWRMSSSIGTRDEMVGEVTIYYSAPRPEEDEGPFLAEERLLLDEIARKIGNHARRRNAEMEIDTTHRQLVSERSALKESNAALRVILARIQEEKQEIHQDINENVQNILLPLLQTMALEFPAPQRDYFRVLQENLENITSPFVRRLSQRFHGLTPTEIKICNLIRNGLTTKEIARLRGVSVATINRHRENIRQKLDLTNQGVNLVTFLQVSM